MESAYKRYSYWLSKNEVISNRHQEDNPANKGDIFLGKWYAHEKTPYIYGGSVVRDWYKKKQVFVHRISGGSRFMVPEKKYSVYDYHDEYIGEIDTDGMKDEEERLLIAMGSIRFYLFWNNDTERYDIHASQEWIEARSGLFSHLEKKSPDADYRHLIG